MYLQIYFFGPSDSLIVNVSYPTILAPLQISTRNIVDIENRKSHGLPVQRLKLRNHTEQTEAATLYKTGQYLTHISIANIPPKGKAFPRENVSRSRRHPLYSFILHKVWNISMWRMFARAYIMCFLLIKFRCKSFFAENNSF